MAPPVAKPGQTASANPAQATAVIDAAILNLLSQPDLARLVSILEPAQSSQNAMRASEALQAAVTAAAAGDAVQALEKASEWIRLDPLRADAVRAEPGLAAIRPQLESVLTRFSNMARLDAETRVAEAARTVEGGQLKALPNWDARPEALVSIAIQLLDAGGPVNSVRAAHVAQVVIDAAHWAPAPVAGPITGELRSGKPDSAIQRVGPSIGRSWRVARKQMPAAVARLWRRAPLLVLLLGWLAVGTAGGLVSWVQRKILPDPLPDGLTDAAFGLWALGFLALVLFGFYVRVRNVKL